MATLSYHVTRLTAFVRVNHPAFIGNQSIWQQDRRERSIVRLSHRPGRAQPATTVSPREFILSRRRLRALFVIKNRQQGGTEGQLLQMMETLDASLFAYRLRTVHSAGHVPERPND